jgi:sulfate permease, SulP family
MAINGVAGGEAPPERSVVVANLRDLFAGAIASILAVAYGLSFAALIFSGHLSPWVAYGIAATFVTSAIGAGIVALRSSIPFNIAGPDGATAAVTAALVATLTERIVASGTTEQLYQPALIVMALSAALTGLFLCLLGVARAGAAIRFVPYPVIGGFLGATGWLMVVGAVRVITGTQPSFASMGALLNPSDLAKLAAACGMAFALYLGLRRGRSPFVLPGILLAGLVLAHIVIALAGTTISEAQAASWMFAAPQGGYVFPWNGAALHDFPWRLLPSLAGDLLAVMFVTAITVLLNTTGIEFVTRREADLERELTTLGFANLVSSAAGGYVTCTSLSRTTLNYAARGRGRLSGLTVAGASLMVLAADPHFLAYVPKYVLGGLLLYLGFSLMYAWLIESMRRLSWLEYASLLAIAFIILQWGFIAGVAIGIIIGCATFAVSASRVNAIKFRFDGSEYRSTLDRGPEELAILASYGHEIQGMSLQSYLFFGSANRLYQEVKVLLKRLPETRFLVFDFRLVTGIDSSAMHSFSQIKQAAEEAGTDLVLVNLPNELGNTFRARGLAIGVTVSSDLDRALETCERAVIAVHSAGSGESANLRDWFAQALGSDEFAKQLSEVSRRLEVEQGEIIATQGEPARSMHFIVEGRVGIIVNMEDGRSVRVRSLGPYTTIGEMGLITQQTRSATIQAEVPSVLYELSAEAYERLKRENGPLAQALLTYVIRVMAERLSFASRVIGVLRR